MTNPARIVSLVEREKACPKDEEFADILPETIAEALAMDVRAAARRYHGVHAAIGKLCGVSADAVYKWVERKLHGWKLAEIRAVMLVTGGAQTMAFLASLAMLSPAQASRVEGVTDYDAALNMSEVLGRASTAMQQMIADMAPHDDTPGALDERELGRHEQIAFELHAASALYLERLRMMRAVRREA